MCCGQRERDTTDQNFKYFKVEVAPTISGPCDKNGPVGEHVGFRPSRAHYVDSWCWGTTLSSFCRILCAIYLGTKIHVGIVNGRATGCTDSHRQSSRHCTGVLKMSLSGQHRDVDRAWMLQQ